MYCAFTYRPKAIVTVFCLMVFFMQQAATTATATTTTTIDRIWLNTLRDTRSVRGGTQPTKKLTLREARPAMSAGHLNLLLGFYGTRKKRLEASPEQRHLINQNAYSEALDEEDAKERKHARIEKNEMNSTKRMVVDGVLKSTKLGKLNSEDFDNIKSRTRNPNESTVDLSNVQNPLNSVKREGKIGLLEQRVQPKWSKLKPGQNRILNRVAATNGDERNAVAENVLLRKNKFSKDDAQLKGILLEQPSIAEAEPPTGIASRGQEDKNYEFGSLIGNAQVDVNLAVKACKLFKRVTEDIYMSKRKVHIGGLYDEYRQRLDNILRQTKREAGITSDSDDPLDKDENELRQKELTSILKSDPQFGQPASALDCGCNAGGGVVVANPTKQDENCKTKNAVKGPTAASKQQLRTEWPSKTELKRHQIPTANTHTKSEPKDRLDPNTYRNVVRHFNQKLAAEKAKSKPPALAPPAKQNTERPANAVFQNPYYLPNSKTKQTTFGELPIKPLKAIATLAVTLAPKVKSKAPSSPSAPVQNSKAPVSISLPEPYAGINASYLKAALQAFRVTPYVSLYDEYQKHLGALNNMLRSKQRWWNEVRQPVSVRSSKIVESRVIAAAPMTDSQLTVDGVDLLPVAALPQTSLQTPVSNLQRREVVPAKQTDPQELAKALEHTLNQSGLGQNSGGLLTNAANKMNISTTELAQRLTSMGRSQLEQSFAQVLRKYLERSSTANAMPDVNPNLNPNPTNSLPAVSSASPNTNSPSAALMPMKRAEVPSGFLSLNTPAPASLLSVSPPTLVQPNMAHILDKILQKLEMIQEFKSQNDMSGSTCENPVNPAKVHSGYDGVPTDGAPCQLTGSWESNFLGIRFDISSNSSAPYKATPCAQQRKRRWLHPRGQRDQTSVKDARHCAKVTNNTEFTDSLQPLDIFAQEIVPPREHSLIENLAEWHFAASAVNRLGGPILLTVWKVGSPIIGTFMGNCRTCGCIDTIFGSWTFCTPSKDCQDITTAVFERRDMLRRYKMDENRRTRYKDELFNRSAFCKAENKRLEERRARLGQRSDAQKPK